MNNGKFLAINILIVIFCFGCTKPRIDPDYSIYGDKAFVKSITTFYYREINKNLNYNEPVTGYQTVNITNTLTVDNANNQIKIVLAKTSGSDLVDLSKIGIRINTDAQRVEPINGAPVAGLIRDFSKGPYTYRLFSADGTTRDWTLNFSIAP